VTDRVRPDPLSATGERLIPELQHGQLVHAEHLARYRFAAQLARGRRVLDVASGEGYGARILAAAGAASVTGADVDEQAVEHARSRYPEAEFVTGDIAKLPLEDGAFDLVVSFETIEHVPKPEEALRELRRVLAPDGRLVISTPNKHQYLVENEFHEREFTHEEFVELLGGLFPSVQVALQHNWTTSAVLEPPAAANARGDTVLRTDFYKVAGIEPAGELYTIAICGAQPFGDDLRGVAVAASTDESHELAERIVERERTAEKWHEEYQRAIQRGEAAIEEMRSTWSWRLTKPFRVGRWLRRRRDG
jgi:SAM-dependent methyltransferase